MLNKIKKLFSSSAPDQNDSSPDTFRIPQSVHSINPHDISGNALRVIHELQAAHFEAYLVGGGVRDLLLGGRPKDFDIATDATPEQVQSVFRRARIIGRRFKIVHVRMGREVMEVTTFRGSHDQGKKRGGQKQQALQSDKGVLLRDNIYGDLESDAYRRDFTINALYYDPSTEEIIDYTGGLKHLNARQLHLIGDADARYKEDPVRMLRAVRFKCKLNFNIDEVSERPIREQSEYLAEIPSARLFEEVLKLFLSGKAERLVEELHKYHLLQYLFPGAASVFDNPDQHAAHDDKLIRFAAQNTDKRIRTGKRVTPAFIYAAFLWPSLQRQIVELRDTMRASEQEILFKAADLVISYQLQRTSIPKRFLIPMREIWSLQLRLNRRDPKRAFSLLEHPRFRAAYDFLLLREQSGELGESSLGAWWTEFQEADRDTQLKMIQSVNKGGNRRRPRRSRSSRNSGSRNAPPSASD